MSEIYDSINLFGRHRYKVIMQREGQFKGTIDAFCKSNEDHMYYIITGYSSITNSYKDKKPLGSLKGRGELRYAKNMFIYKQEK